jgi:hypothetical protein
VRDAKPFTIEYVTGAVQASVHRSESPPQPAAPMGTDDAPGSPVEPVALAGVDDTEQEEIYLEASSTSLR